MRVGQGFDVHPFETGRPLVLGGVLFEGETGLAGHSDADVLTHAICDALLGAAALGDIGSHFPDTDPHFKGASSLDMLAHVIQLLTEQGYRIANIDSTIITEKPKLAPYIPTIRQQLANVMKVD